METNKKSNLTRIINEKNLNTNECNLLFTDNFVCLCDDLVRLGFLDSHMPNTNIYTSR